MTTPCPLCHAPYGFHEDSPHDALQPGAYRKPADAAPVRQVRPSDEEIARRRRELGRSA